MTGNYKTTFVVGCLLIAVGVLCNKWMLQPLFSPDGQIDSLGAILTIVLFQATAVGAGLYLIWQRKPLITYKEILLVAFSTILSLLMLEIGIRVWLERFAPENQRRRYQISSDFNPQQLQWSAHHYLNYFPTPNYRRGLTSHNALGYRGETFSARKPQGVYRIVALGGSTTYTVAVEDNTKTFTSQLEKTLKDVYGYPNVEVINAGVGGYNSWESLINLEFRVLDLDPDLVIIYHGTNDVHTRMVTPAVYRGDNSGRRKQWSPPHTPLMIKHSYLLRVVSKKLNLDYFSSVGLASFVDAPTFPGTSFSDPVRPMKLLETNAPIYFRRNLINMIAIAKANRVEILLSTWAYSPHFGVTDYSSTPHYQHGFKENNDVVREVADQHNAILFDFAKVMPSDQIYWHDGRHVNEKGALKKAQLFAEFIHQSGLSITDKKSGSPAQNSSVTP